MWAKDHVPDNKNARSWFAANQKVPKSISAALNELQRSKLQENGGNGAFGSNKKPFDAGDNGVFGPNSIFGSNKKPSGAGASGVVNGGQDLIQFLSPKSQAAVGVLTED